jgi:hypothetical protein
MQNARKIVDVLSALQEGWIEEMRMEHGDLNIKVDCSHLAQLIAPTYQFFYLVLKKVEDIYFEPWDEEETKINSVKDILIFKPDIINVELEDSGYIKLYSNCTNVYSGGNIFMLAQDVLIFDEDFIELSPERLSELSEKYWYSDKT